MLQPPLPPRAAPFILSDMVLGRGRGVTAMSTGQGGANALAAPVLLLSLGNPVTDLLWTSSWWTSEPSGMASPTEGSRCDSTEGSDLVV